jgi:hypothetical protein
MDTNFSEVDDVARLILSYLQTNNEAGDTLEGIVRWWILRQRLDESMTVVQLALDKLKAEGIIAERQGTDRRIIYYFAKSG